MGLKDKYPISDWVLGQDNVSPGDFVAFFCEETQDEILAEVIALPPKELRQYISCRRIGSAQSELINIYNTIVYKVKKSYQLNHDCSCGAKYTSNPRFHLSYCSLAVG